MCNKQSVFPSHHNSVAAETSPTHQPAEEDGQVQHELVVLHVEVIEDLGQGIEIHTTDNKKHGRRLRGEGAQKTRLERGAYSQGWVVGKG